MLEIIKRENINTPSAGKLVHVISEKINGNQVQISFNSWGHLVVRIIRPDGDILAVFDAATTRQILNFCQVVGKK